jgi:nucleoside-diphosphate-sugar epimerase
MQAEGAPIVVTYPGGVFAPDDPKLSEANRALRAFLRVVPRTTSGMQFVDGRDLAAAHVRLLERRPAGDPAMARYIVGGHFVRWAEIHALLERLTGRRIFAPWSPGALLRAMGVVMDGVRRIHPIEFPVTRESMAIATSWPPASSARVVEATGVSFRPPEHTVRDTLRWLVAAGHVARTRAGAPGAAS